MGQKEDYTFAIKPRPLEITYELVYKVLLDIFPEEADLIVNAIKKIVVIKKDSPQFSTMGITSCGTLYVSQVFWDTYMQDENSLATVLLHELMHVVGGDVFTLKTSKDGKDWKLRNYADLIAMDSRINAYICCLHSDINPDKFLKLFYNEEVLKQECLHKLLRPDSLFNSTEEEDIIRPYYNTFYKALEFCDHGQLSDAIFNILKKRREENPEEEEKTQTVILLGSHGQDGQEVTEQDLQEILDGDNEIKIIRSEPKEEKSEKLEQTQDSNVSESTLNSNIEQIIKEAISDKLSIESAYNTAGKNKQVSTQLLETLSDITEHLDILKFKNFTSDSLFTNVRSQAKVRTAKYSTSPFIPTRISNSDLLFLSAGLTPLLWKSRKYETRLDNRLLPIYLDVSGSVYSYLPRLIKLVSHISSNIDYVWGFSNRVEKHTKKELSDGIIKGTGGTDFDCIVEHAIENRFKNIVVITDGWANAPKLSAKDFRRNGSIPSKKIKEIKSVATVLFGRPNNKNYFSETYGSTKTIDEVLR